MRALSGGPGQVSAGEIACIDIRHDVAVDVEGNVDVGIDVDVDDVSKPREHLQRAMIEGAGVLRSPASLAAAASEIGDVARQLSALSATGGAGRAGAGGGRARGELANLVTVSGALLGAAYVREETRGAHARRDFPEARPQWRCRLVHRTVATPGTLP
jgi:succinate dehydrogenase/fumarate reductase flavoprotein subunit